MTTATNGNHSETPAKADVLEQSAIDLPAEVAALITAGGHTVDAALAAVRAASDAPQRLTAADVPVILGLLTQGQQRQANLAAAGDDLDLRASLETSLSWAEVATDVRAKVAAEEAAANPFQLPMKLDLPFTKALLGEVTEGNLEKWNVGLKSAAACSAGLGAAIPGASFMLNLIDAYPTFFNFDCGDGVASPEFSAAPSLVIMSGFGFVVLRYYAHKRGSAGEAHWSTIEHMSDDELRTAIFKARRMSGAAAGILLLDFHAVVYLLEDVEHPDQRIISASLLIYLFATMRLYHCEAGWMVRLITGTSYNTINVTKSLNVAFSSRPNRDPLSSVAGVLNLPLGAAKKDSKGSGGIRAACSRVMAMLTPSSLPSFRKLPPNIILATKMRLDRVGVRPERGFYSLNARASGARIVDMETGDVSRYEFTGRDVLDFNLPYPTDPTNFDVSATESELDFLPAKLYAELPGRVILTEAFMTVQTIFDGESYIEEMIAVIDMFVATDMIRSSISGSLIGQTLVSEFPGFFVGSRFAGVKNTTGQGKTTFANVLVKLVVPEAKMVRIGRMTGTVAQRTSAMQAMDYGIFAADEFKLPEEGDDHWADRDGLQSMQTGSPFCVGKAGKNEGATCLRHYVIISGKYDYFPQDILDRNVPILLGHRTPPTKS